VPIPSAPTAIEILILSWCEWTDRKVPTHAAIAGIDEEKIDKAWIKIFVNRPFPSREPFV